MACSDCFGKCIGCDADGLPEYQGPPVPVLTAGAGITLTTAPSGECGLGVTIAATASPPALGCGLELDGSGAIAVKRGFNAVLDTDQVLGNATVLGSGSGRVFRCNAVASLTNIECSREIFMTQINAGFGITALSPTAQVLFGTYIDGGLLQVSQSPLLSGAWQDKRAYPYPPISPTSNVLAPGATVGNSVELFVEVVSGLVIWVDADVDLLIRYGS